MPTQQSPALPRQSGGRARAFLLLLRGGWRMVRVNLIAVAFCLPIVTVGPALAAACGVLVRQREGDPVRVAYHYCDAFEREVLRAFLCSLFALALGTAFALPMRGCFAGAADNGWLWLPAALLAALLLWLVCASCFVLTLLGNGGLTLGAVLGMGVVLPLFCWRASLLLILVNALFAWLLRVLWPFSLAALLLAGIAAYLWLVVRICLPPVRRVVRTRPPVQGGEGED